MEPKLIILDLDGTVRQCIEHKASCHNQSGKWEIIPGTQKVLKLYDWTEVGIGFATNQAPIALKQTTAAAVEHEIQLTIKALFPEWPMTTVIDEKLTDTLYSMHHERRRMPERGPVFRYSPFAPDASSYARKPSPWMILDIVREYGERLDRTLYVGDSPEDRESAMRAGVDFIWAWEFFGRPRVEPNTVKAHVSFKPTKQDWTRLAK